MNDDEIVYTVILTGCTLAAVMLIMSLLSGCSSRGELAVEQQKIAAMNRPLVSFECPESGCVIKSFTVHNPEQIKLPKETNGWDTVNKLLAVVAALAPEAKTAYIAGEFLKAAVSKSHSETSTETNTTTADSNNVTTNDEMHTTTSDSNNTATSDETHSHNETTNTSDSSGQNNSITDTTTDTVTTTTSTTTTDNSDNSDHSNNSDNSERNNATDSSF